MICAAVSQLMSVSWKLMSSKQCFVANETVLLGFSIQKSCLGCLFSESCNATVRNASPAMGMGKKFIFSIRIFYILLVIFMFTTSFFGIEQTQCSINLFNNFKKNSLKKTASVVIIAVHTAVLCGFFIWFQKRINQVSATLYNLHSFFFNLFFFDLRAYTNHLAVATCKCVCCFV